MAHSHDRTLLARFGFQDPDLKEPIHDLACEYMALEENAVTLTKMVSTIEKEHLRQCHRIDGRYVDGDLNCRVSDTKFKCKSNVESALTKGIDQYKTTIGFLDVSIRWESSIRIVGTFVRTPEEKWVPPGEGEVSRKLIKISHEPVEIDEWQIGPSGSIVVEVKIHQIGVGELVRQMNLYREHFNGGGSGDFGGYYNRSAHFVVAVAYDVDGYYRDALTREGITLVKLGDKFHEWGAAHFGTNKAEIPEF